MQRSRLPRSDADRIKVSVQCSGLPEPASRLPRTAQRRPEMLVGVAGFEPATPASRTQCSTGLSHTPTWNAAYSLRFWPPQEAELRNFIPVNLSLKTQILSAGPASVASAAAWLG